MAMLLAASMTAMAQGRDDHGTYGQDGRMTGYTDPETGLTLKISGDRHRITAFDSSGKTRWSRADIIEPQLILPGNAATPPHIARIADFQPLPDEKKTLPYLRKQGLKGKILVIRYSAGSCCGGAQGFISEEDGKLLPSGVN